MKKALENIKWLEDVFIIRKEEQGFEVNIVNKVIKNTFTEVIKELEDLQNMVASFENKEGFNHLEFIYNRLIYLGENPNIDFMLKLKNIVDFSNSIISTCKDKK